MMASHRKAFNSAFTNERYEKMLGWIAEQYRHSPSFKISETPVFVPRDLKDRLFEACEEIVDLLVRPDFRELSAGALLSGQSVPGETPHTTFLQMDFGICLDEAGHLLPQLIEVQGFPSLYFFQHLLAEAYRRHYAIPEGFGHLFSGLDKRRYLDLLRTVIVGDHDPENVILLEVEPDKQPTLIDFIICRKLLGVQYCCVSDLLVDGRKVYYERDGRRIRVERIFNRVIFDELIKRDDLPREFFFIKEHDVEWAGHPNWFFRISKHTLPLLESRYVPTSRFLHELDGQLPDDLHNYVLKPLYSFAGTGVIINCNRFDLEAITDPENYILQRKVRYAPVVPTPDDPAKCEVRMLMLWEKDAARPLIVNNLVRLSKGQMVGTRYNRDRTWVGGSVGFFEGE